MGRPPRNREEPASRASRPHHRGIRATLAGPALVALVAVTGCSSSRLETSGDDGPAGAGGVGGSAPTTTAAGVPATTAPLPATAPPTTAPPTTAPPTTVPPTTVPPTTAPPTTVPPTTDPPTTVPPATVPPAAPQPLRPGDHGPAVERLQRRLTELRYWVGPIDGAYGVLTRQAVYAFEKTAGRPVDGALSTADQAALDAAGPVAPRSGPGRGEVVEVDKARQVLIIARDGATRWVFNTSTGTERPYVHPTAGPSMADTPPGDHTISWQYDGSEPGELGPLYRPKYFHSDGIAIHGYGSVPPAPASHGCVRITFAAMDLLWDEGLAPPGTPVWVYGVSPAPVAAR